ncbi:MAG: DUF3365 domain-containing protein, partial [bacterium]|nr:DUF3365 domain-containing protein [bacterium]
MMWDQSQWNLRTKFLAWSGLILLIWGLGVSVAYYRHLRKALIQEALNKSELILQEVEATRDYVEQVLRPKMYTLVPKNAFILEAMSTTYVTIHIMNRFGEKMPGYRYRRVSLNPRNPANRADESEEAMFEWFEDDRSRDRWQGMVEKEGEPYLVTMIPDYVDAGCLLCHGNVQDAPPAILEQYSAEGGFRFTEGDLIGLNSVSVPMSRALSKALKLGIAIFFSTLLATGALLILFNLLFHKLVIARLSRVVAAVPRSKNVPEDRAIRSKDELDTLHESFGYLNRYVTMARKGSALEPNFIGAYSLEGPLAAGTLSWLYGARDSRSDNRVSVKIPFPDVMENPLYMTCLHTEMAIFESCSHSNLVAVTEREGEFLILEALSGQDFRQMLDTRPPGPADDLQILFRHLCDLLAYLHNRGIVHHDLRPDTMMITPAGTLKLFDLGYASWREVPDVLFESGLGPQGDFRYMAPEQLSGKRGDPRSDIYALGVLLYRAVTGRLPFDKHRSTVKHWLHLKKTFEVPGRHVDGLSREMESLILKAMAW